MKEKIILTIIIITANLLHGQDCICYKYTGSTVHSANKSQDVTVLGYMLDSSAAEYLDLKKSLESKFSELIHLSHSSQLSQAKLLFDFEVTNSDISFYGHITSKQLIGVICDPADNKRKTALFLISLNENDGAYPINFNVSEDGIFFTKTTLIMDNNSLLFNIINGVGLGADIENIIVKCDEDNIDE